MDLVRGGLDAAERNLGKWLDVRLRQTEMGLSVHLLPLQRLGPGLGAGRGGEALSLRPLDA